MTPVTKKARVEDSNDSSVTVNDPASGFIRFEIDDVSNKAPFRLFSPEIEVLGTPWKLIVQKTATSPYLWVILYHRASDSGIWSIDVTAKISIINVDEGNNRILMLKNTFNKEMEGWGCTKVILWENLIDVEKGFIKDDKIIFEAQFTLSNIVGIRVVPRIDFTDPDEPRHDVTLVIGGEKIYANKAILSVHSPVLNAMFYGNFVERNKKEIELKDIDRKEFITMLNLIYPSYEKITDDNAESLLKLADRFQIKMIIDQVEQFLIDSTKLNILSKLKLSDDYRLVKLEEHCLGTFEAVNDVMDLNTSDIYKGLSDKAKATLLDKAMKLR